jgi:DNA-binding NtrC family response regulator
LCRNCILIIDDNKSVLRILAKILESAGFKCGMANSGKEALKKLKEHNFELAIIDVRLKDMNGLDLLETIQKTPSTMKKIILTGYPSDEDKIRAKELGAHHYLSKPIKSQKLIEIIQKSIK